MLCSAHGHIMKYIHNTGVSAVAANYDMGDLDADAFHQFKPLYSLGAHVWLPVAPKICPSANIGRARRFYFYFS